MANNSLEINQLQSLKNNDNMNNNNNNNTIHGPRSIDDYLDSAYQHTCTSRAQNGLLFDLLQHWRYYIIFLALGIANTGDSAEMGVTNYILSSSKFQHDILNAGEGVEGDGEADFAQRGAAIAGAHFAGMVSAHHYFDMLQIPISYTNFHSYTCTTPLIAAASTSLLVVCYQVYLLIFGVEEVHYYWV